jgi:molybdopterin-guanine dinucleotide biosynthesis protein MobB
MRIINITGRSGSGKTTFIRNLVPELSKSGPTATIKHLGHHNFVLEPGKDTTLLYESGACISAGIDAEKTVTVRRDPALVRTLDYLCDQGMRYTVIEGFKTLDLPSIVIGDLQAGHVLFRNPSQETIIDNLSVFPEYHTKSGLEMEVWKQWESEHASVPPEKAVILSVAAGIDTCGIEGSVGGMAISEVVREVSDDLSGSAGNAIAGISLRPWWLFGGRKELYMSSVAPGYEAASSLVSRGIILFRQRCEERGMTLSVNGW